MIFFYIYFSWIRVESKINKYLPWQIVQFLGNYWMYMKNQPTLQISKSADWPPNYQKMLIIFPTKILKRLHAARIDELAESN